MPRHPRTLLNFALLASLLALTPAMAADVGIAQATAVHKRLLVLDSHLDTPANFSRPGWDFFERHDHALDGSQVDWPRMREGGLDGGLWVIYTPQTGRSEADQIQARDHGLRRLAEIRELVAAHPDRMELALTPEDATRIKADGKLVVYLSMENAAPLSRDPSLLAHYHQQGLRVMGITHTSNNDFGDSANTPAEWNGLSSKGVELVRAAQALGILIDQSHASDAVFDQLIALSPIPFILSHTSADDVYEHPRNIDDGRIRQLAAHGGLIMVNSLGSYLKDIGQTPAYRDELRALYERFGGRRGLKEADLPRFQAEKKALDERHGLKPATLDDYMAHILHIIEVAGPEHVGFGADWDGGGGVAGLEDVSLLPLITQRLLQAGYSEKDLAAMWGGNLLRVLGAAQAAATVKP